MKTIEATHKSWVLLFGALTLALCLTMPRAIAGETGSTDEYSGVARTNSVLLDPFDPVPTIRFDRRCGWDCDRGCRHEGCEGWHDRYRHGDRDGYLLCFLDATGIRSRVASPCIVKISNVLCRADGGILGMEH